MEVRKRTINNMFGHILGLYPLKFRPKKLALYMESVPPIQSDPVAWPLIKWAYGSPNMAVSAQEQLFLVFQWLGGSCSERLGYSYSLLSMGSELWSNELSFPTTYYRVVFLMIYIYIYIYIYILRQSPYGQTTGLGIFGCPSC